MPKVSVIIPIYNACEYLKQCLDSIINQTLNDIEIILIDDGSIDKSTDIIKEYSLKDNRINAIYQCNKGAGAARNAGLRIAKGKYLSFLDADDYFELIMLEKLYNRCEETNADIVIYKAKRYDNEKKEITGDLGWTTLHGIPSRMLFSYKDVEQFYQCCSSVAWDKFFRKSFIDESNIKFQEISYCNDVFFTHSLLALTERITALDEYLVYYRDNTKESLTATSIYDPICFYESIKETQKKLRTLPQYNLINKSYCNWAVNFCFFHLFYRKNICFNIFKITYNALRDYIFKEIGVADKDPEYFYDDYSYSRIHDIISMHFEEYCLKSVLERYFLKSENICLKKERDETNKILNNIYNSYSFRFSRILTWIPSKLKKYILKK